MPPNPLPRHAVASGRGGFTLIGALASLALLAAAVAVCVPLVVKRLGAHTPAADDAARRVESAVTRGLASVGAMADSYSGGIPGLPLRADLAGPAVAASLPDGPIRGPAASFESGDGPMNPPPFPPPWRTQPLFWKPFFTRPAPWYFYRRPLWRTGGWRRR
jgi:hypothetical protein